MAPKVKITKEDIIEAAIELVRQRGELALNARNLATTLNCSTQPIFSNFSSMEELRMVVIAQADKLCNQYIKDEVKCGIYPAYKATGMAYIRFAKEEKELFKLLDIPMLPALKIKGRTKTQHFLTREQRAENYANSLYCNADVTGARILLVDDVITTCSTAEACSSTLLKAGAKYVHVVAFASVSFKEASMPEKKPTLLDRITKLGRF